MINSRTFNDCVNLIETMYYKQDLIIITLFQEDNIFDRYASLTYGPQLQIAKVGMSLTKLFTVCTEQVRTPYAASGLPNPTSLGGGGEVRFVQAQDQQVVTSRSPRIITECLLTRKLLFFKCMYMLFTVDFA